MLILRNIIIVILLLILAAVAVVGFMVEMPPVVNWTPDRVNALGRSVLEVMRPGHLLFIIWASIIIALLLVFLITVARPRRRMKIEVQMGGGRVVIMDAAIKKYIRNALSELGEVTVKKIDLREHRNLVTTDITADVRTRENLPTLERRIISRVRTALAEDLGITNLGDVHVFIRNFEVTGRPIKPAPAAADKGDASKKNLKTDPEEETAVIEEPEDRNSGAGSSAITGAATGGAATAAGAHALSDPVEPPGANEPIVLDDSTESATSTDTTSPGSTGDTPPGADTAGVTESSASVSLDEKPDNVGSDDTFDAAPAEPGADHDDLDHHPAPWEQTTKPDDDDRDPEDRGPLPL